MTNLTRPRVGAAARLALSAILAGCFGGWPTEVCTSCESVVPFLPYFLRGDTLRLSAGGYEPSYMGDALANWSLPDTAVVSITNSTSAKLASSATNVLLRGNAPGQVVITISFPGSKSAAKQNPVTVADSSVIKSIVLLRYSLTDTIRVGAQQGIGVFLSDAASNNYYAQPESLYVGDTSLVDVTRFTNYDRRLQLSIVGKKAGTTSLVARFRAITATRTIIVVP